MIAINGDKLSSVQAFARLKCYYAACHRRFVRYGRSINTMSDGRKTFDYIWEKTEKVMKATKFIPLRAVLSACLLSAVTLISSHSQNSAMGFDKKLGQDVAGKNCERIDTSESSTFGKCENVCKDKEVTRDAPNNRWVCNASKAVVKRPLVERGPVVVKEQDPGANPPSRRQPPAGIKTVKAKKN